MRVYYTTYDGYYIVCDKGKTTAYEGKALCPPKVIKWLQDNKPGEIHQFHMDAIAYGYCK